MESTLYGHPDFPKRGPDMPPFVSRFSSGEAGLTFEPNGLRGRLVLQLEEKGSDGEQGGNHDGR